MAALHHAAIGALRLAGTTNTANTNTATTDRHSRDSGRTLALPGIA
ncbi:hypothetical protein [Micromonospora sp. WMMD987]|jgi:hypothetical protein|nr:hypothetical protein [Micromonospora sp. WMMD987]WFE97883.1 hypothetical protein O7612_13795 [Micromonospora sp. WMMD987]